MKAAVPSVQFPARTGQLRPMDGVRAGSCLSEGERGGPDGLRLALRRAGGTRQLEFR